ncbi:MAG: hypothetical protein V3S47_05250 [Acidobacteriota bacterium]
MSHPATTTRRDLRHEVRRGIAFVEFEIAESGKGKLRGDLTSVSAAGLTFELDTDAGVEQGALVQAATVLIGECAIEGDLAVKFVRRMNESRIETGCVFYPSSHIGAEKWSAVVAVMKAVCTD